MEIGKRFVKLRAVDEIAESPLRRTVPIDLKSETAIVSQNTGRMFPLRSGSLPCISRRWARPGHDPSSGEPADGQFDLVQEDAGQPVGHAIRRKLADGPVELLQSYMRLVLENVAISQQDAHLSGSSQILEPLAQNGPSRAPSKRSASKAAFSRWRLASSAQRTRSTRLPHPCL